MRRIILTVMALLLAQAILWPVAEIIRMMPPSSTSFAEILGGVSVVDGAYPERLAPDAGSNPAASTNY